MKFLRIETSRKQPITESCTVDYGILKLHRDITQKVNQ